METAFAVHRSRKKSIVCFANAGSFERKAAIKPCNLMTDGTVVLRNWRIIGMKGFSKTRSSLLSDWLFKRQSIFQHNHGGVNGTNVKTRFFA